MPLSLSLDLQVLEAKCAIEHSCQQCCLWCRWEYSGVQWLWQLISSASTAPVWQHNQPAVKGHCRPGPLSYCHHGHWPIAYPITSAVHRSSVRLPACFCCRRRGRGTTNTTPCPADACRRWPTTARILHPRWKPARSLGIHGNLHLAARARRFGGQYGATSRQRWGAGSERDRRVG